MKAKLLGMLIAAVMEILTPDLLKEFVDRVLDWVEDRVAGSASTVDDRVLLPICDLIRRTFDVPDDDELFDPADPGPVPAPGPLSSD